MLFIQPVKRGIIVKSASLASGLRVFALRDKLLGGNEAFRKNIAVNGRSRCVAKNAVEVRFANVHVLCDRGEGEWLKKVGVNVVYKAVSNVCLGAFRLLFSV